MGSKERKSSWNWETLTKIVSAGLAILTLFFGILQYRDQNVRQYRQKIYDEQFKIYSEILDLSGKLSITPLDSVITPGYKLLNDLFDKLYFGKMNMIQDTTVEHAMIVFKKAKDQYNASDPDMTPKIFQNYSVKLGVACKESLVKTQTINIDQLFSIKKGE